ncbi:MAG: hypothetical protein WAU88_00055 [Candidatus Zixiibacteriota bacterium]
MALRRGLIACGAACALLLVGVSVLNAEEGTFPGTIGFTCTTNQAEPSFLFILETVMVANGFTLDARSISAEHSYTYSFRWTRPDTDKDFWKADNKWHGDGELTARLVPGGTVSEMTWKIALVAKTYSFDVTRADMEKVILELLQAKLQSALSDTGRK